VGRKTTDDTISPELGALLAELEITAVSTTAYRAPMATMAVETMESILRQHGYSVF
jgi:hypothetical protein